MFDDRFMMLFDEFVSWPLRLGKEGPFVETILEEAGARKVVDAGAGSGRHAVYLARKGYNVFATDIASCMVDETRRHAEDQGADLEVLHCSFEAIPEHVTAPQDAVICLGNSLCMLPDAPSVSRALEGFFKILRPGGVLLLHALNYRGLRARDKRVSRPTVLEDGGLLVKFFDLEPEATRVNFIRLMPRDAGTWKSEHNWAPLLPLSREDFEAMLGKAGFGGFQAFGAADGRAYEPDASYDLFLKAVRRT